MEVQDSHTKSAAERAIVNFISLSFDRYKYSLQMLSECITEIESSLDKCDSEERYELLNSKYIDGPDRNWPLSSLIRICVARIHNQCEIKPQSPEIKSKTTLLCSFSCRLIQSGLNPMLPFWEDNQHNISAMHNSQKVRLFNGFRQVDSWSYTLFTKLAESIEFSSEVNMTDIYSLVFDIIATFKGDSHYPYLSAKSVKPAILTLPIWKDTGATNTVEMRRRILSDLTDIWICGSAFLSMYGGYSPTRGDFTPSVLQLALDKLSKYPDQKLFRFINMDEYHRLLPQMYDHQFVLETQLNRSDAVMTLKKVLDYAYNDIITESNKYYSHYSVIVYIFLIKEFYQNYKSQFCNELQDICKRFEECIPLLYDIIHQTINDYYFEDLSFVDSELDRHKVICIFLSQLHKFGAEWQDWIDTHLIPKFSNEDIRIFEELLFDHPTIAQYVVTSYKNTNLTQFVLRLYSGHLNFEQMIEILCTNGMKNAQILQEVFNEKRIDFEESNVGDLFTYVMIALMLKSEYFLNEALMVHVLRVCKTHKGYNTQESISNSLQHQFITLCQFPLRESDKIAKNNICQFLKGLQRNTDDFDIDFNRGFIECVGTAESQYQPNVIVLKFLFDLELLDYNICKERDYLRQSILSPHPRIVAMINEAWPSQQIH